MLNLFLTNDTAVMLAGVACLVGYVCGLGMMATLLWPRLHRRNTGCERLLRMALDDRDRQIERLMARIAALHQHRGVAA